MPFVVFKYNKYALFDVQAEFDNYEAKGVVKSVVGLCPWAYKSP